MEAQWATCVIEAAERSMSAELKTRAGGSTAAAWARRRWKRA